MFCGHLDFNGENVRHASYTPALLCSVGVLVKWWHVIESGSNMNTLSTVEKGEAGIALSRCISTICFCQALSHLVFFICQLFQLSQEYKLS